MSWIAAAVVGSAAIGAFSSNKAAKAQSKAAKDAAAASERAANESNAMQREMYELQREDMEPWRDTGGAALNQLSVLMGLDVEPAAMARENLSYDDIYRDVYDEQRDLLSLRYTNRKGKVDTWGLDAAAKAAAAPIAQKRFDEQQAQYQAKQAEYDALKETPAFGSLTRQFGADDFEADPGYAFRQAEGQKAIERSAAARGGLVSGSALKATQRFGQDLASQEYMSAYNRFNTNQNNQYNRFASLAGVGQTANNSLAQAGQNYANAFTGITQANAANQGNALIAQGNARASGYLGIGNAIGGAMTGLAGGGGGYQMGTGTMGNAFAMSQGYQPLNHSAANAGFYD